jgi:ankyrin repeat protein
MKKRKPCINSGVKLPLNQAILRGNPFIIRSLIEFGKPHPFVRDGNGRSPVHIAGSKLDMETLDALVDEVGSDPMQPDNDGNTILHTLCLGVITDKEYDFVKFCI